MLMEEDLTETSTGCACEDGLAQAPIGPARVATGVRNLSLQVCITPQPLSSSLVRCRSTKAYEVRPQGTLRKSFEALIRVDQTKPRMRVVLNGVPVRSRDRCWFPLSFLIPQDVELVCDNRISMKEMNSRKLTEEVIAL